MKRLLSIPFALALFSVVALGAYPPEAETTLKGTILCARCVLKETKKCNTTIVVRESGKSTKYYFNDRGADEEHHEEVCGGGRKQGTVTGSVFQRNGKRWITPRKVEYAKE